MRVEVYWNLHRKCFSIRALEGPYKGRVVWHSPAVDVDGAAFIVRASGREKVRREGRKNVHAFVRGNLSGLFVRGAHVPEDFTPITYNPYRDDHFVTADGDRDEVYFTNRASLREIDGKGRIWAHAMIVAGEA